MGLFDYRDLTKEEVLETTSLANAALGKDPVPAIWKPLGAADLGLAADQFDGIFFKGENGYPTAAALAVESLDGKTLAISFRGTDDLRDVAAFPELLKGGYLDAFTSLLTQMGKIAGDYDRVIVTGHSLGAGAANLLRDAGDKAYSGGFADAYYVTVASPVIAKNQDILNIGFENDWVFKSGEDLGAQRPDYASTTDNLIYFDSNYAGRNLVFDPVTDLTAHKLEPGDPYDVALRKITASGFYDDMTRDSVVLLDAYNGEVSDKQTITSDHEGEGAFIIGGPKADKLRGADATDRLDGSGGNDKLDGRGGDDFLHAGDGNDTLLGGGGDDVLNGGLGNDKLDGGVGAEDVAVFGGDRDGYLVTLSGITLTVKDIFVDDGDDGTDRLTNIERLAFADGLVDAGAAPAIAALLTPVEIA